MRIGVLAVLLAIVFAAAEVWRRAVMRYIPDSRRRIAMWCGVNFIWREIVLNLPAGIDYAAAKEKLTSAVTNAVKEYRDEIVRQTKEIQRATASDSADDGRRRRCLVQSPAWNRVHRDPTPHKPSAMLSLRACAIDGAFRAAITA
ncbi:MAG: hypothetical protein ABJD53_13545 [Gammaproteobacteria bacterium]